MHYNGGVNLDLGYHFCESCMEIWRSHRDTASIENKTESRGISCILRSVDTLHTKTVAPSVISCTSHRSSSSRCSNGGRLCSKIYIRYLQEGCHLGPLLLSHSTIRSPGNVDNLAALKKTNQEYDKATRSMNRSSGPGSTRHIRN